MSVKLIRFGSNPPAVETGKPGNVVSGNPSTKLQNYYTDTSGQFFAGIWEASPANGRSVTAKRNFAPFWPGK